MYNLSDLYKRQEKLGLFVPISVLVVGCGGVGTWVSIFFAMHGTREFILVDPDVLEVHNLNRLPFLPEDIGKPKVDVLRDFIARIRPETGVLALQGTFQHMLDNIKIWVNIKRLKPIIIDAVDNNRTSNDILAFAKERNLPYLDIKYDGFYFSVRWARSPNDLSETWESDEEDGYRTVPSFVGSAAFPALFGFLAAVFEKDIYYIRKDMREVL